MSFILGLVSLRAIKAEADPVGADDIHMKVGSNTVLNDVGFSTGSIVENFADETLAFNSPATFISLKDLDVSPDDRISTISVGPNVNDPIGSVVQLTATISGGRSQYELKYATINLGNQPLAFGPA